MIKVDVKTNCSGCTACAAVCPKNCINIEMDKEGFYYPYVNEENCIDCEVCIRVCPIGKDQSDRQERSTKMDIYGCQILSNNIRLQSTSGGMFTALAEYILKQNGVVFAAGFDENMHVIHKKAVTSEQLCELRGAKYTQSELKDVFQQIKILTDQHTPILFVGTPCQVEGLLYYTGYKDTLLTADLVCYGVPSPGLYDRYIRYIGKKYGSPVREIYFRDKKYGYSGVNVKVILNNGKKLEDNLDVKSYGKSMFSQLGLRPICYSCPFRSRRKLADFTLGDFWEIGQYDSLMDDETGVTRVSVHTEKGREVFQQIKEKIRYSEVGMLEGDALIEHLEESVLNRTCDLKKRQDFFSDMHVMEYDVLMKKYLPFGKKDRINNIAKPMIRFLLPRFVAQKIFQMKKKGKSVFKRK